MAHERRAAKEASARSPRPSRGGRLLEGGVHEEERAFESLLKLRRLVVFGRRQADEERAIGEAEAEVAPRLVAYVEPQAGQAAVVLVVREGEPVQASADRPSIGQGELPVEADDRQWRKHVFVLGAEAGAAQAHVVA